MKFHRERYKLSIIDISVDFASFVTSRDDGLDGVSWPAVRIGPNSISPAYQYTLITGIFVRACLCSYLEYPAKLAMSPSASRRRNFISL